MKDLHSLLLKAQLKIFISQARKIGIDTALLAGFKARFERDNLLINNKLTIRV